MSWGFETASCARCGEPGKRWVTHICFPTGVNRPTRTTDASGVLQEEPPSPSVEAHPEPRKEQS